ncbi:hypothetical protein [Commensalibacter nepenthis]|uniref:Transposase n=1 Tax=Commensalibacter nepenthis TaxID=3043872 RepID=A0ABT6Q6L7_9PROT|nr:hypothetical protein [Commensalibacter sp. TBRC 10068]MDI2112538.1 hypothetical protein [Commensalibacter sp. TBRC 10068]
MTMHRKTKLTLYHREEIWLLYHQDKVTVTDMAKRFWSADLRFMLY